MSILLELYISDKVKRYIANKLEQKRLVDLYKNTAIKKARKMSKELKQEIKKYKK